MCLYFPQQKDMRDMREMTTRETKRDERRPETCRDEMTKRDNGEMRESIYSIYSIIYI